MGGQLQAQLKVLVIVLINGLVTACVMIKTIILNVILMEVIVVKMNLQMDGINTVVIVPVLKSQKQLKSLRKGQLIFHQNQVNVLINGLGTTSVMIKITIL